MYFGPHDGLPEARMQLAKRFRPRRAHLVVVEPLPLSASERCVQARTRFERCLALERDYEALLETARRRSQAAAEVYALAYHDQCEDDN